jgi:hypothetical protein
MPEFVYRREGDVFTPTEWAGSPWSRELQHGGPVCGLVARAAEAAAGETGLRVARLTVDLCRPTPLAPLTVAGAYLRRGRRLALLEVRILRGEEAVTRATALLLAPSPERPSAFRQAEPPPPGPDGLARFHFMPREYEAQVPPGFHKSLEVRLAEDELGPALWVTTPLALVAGEPLSPTVRAAMLSDLTFGLSGRLLLRRGALRPDPRYAALINADVTLYLDRPPTGEWVAMRSGAINDGEGIAVAEVVQLDGAGRYGRSLQALVTQSA